MANKKPEPNETNAAAEIIEDAQTKTESRFSKAQLISAEHFRGKRDVLNALLSADKSYTVKEAEQIIEKYMKGQVK